MSNHHESDESPVVDRPVDYKTLFMGACGLVTLLGGGMVSVWNHASEQSVIDKRVTDEKQWEQIGALNRTVVENGKDIKRTVNDLADHETRIRELERHLNTKHR